MEIGHSERRHIFRETDEEERAKVLKAVQLGLYPLLCVGETARQKELGIADEVLSIQLKVGAGALTGRQAQHLIAAYEPVWAIGTQGIPADPSYVRQRHLHLRKVLTDLFGPRVGGDIPILFGGSVNPGNAAAYIGLPHVNGLFVGRSAWKKGGYMDLVRQCLPIYQEKLSAKEVD